MKIMRKTDSCINWSSFICDKYSLLVNKKEIVKSMNIRKKQFDTK